MRFETIASKFYASSWAYQLGYGYCTWKGKVKHLLMPLRRICCEGEGCDFYYRLIKPVGNLKCMKAVGSRA